MIIMPSEDENGMISLPQDLRGASKTRVNGDRYILARFNLMYGTMVEDSSNDLGELMSKIPEHMWEEDLSVCEVAEWRADKSDPSYWHPVKLKSLFTVTYHDSPTGDD